MCSQEQLPATADTCPSTSSQNSYQGSQQSQSLDGLPWGYVFPLQPGWPWKALTEENILVGRSPGCNLVLGDSIDAKIRCQFSKEHFVITKQGPNVIITDLSFNGTFLNHVKVKSSRKDRNSLPLRHNDKISLALMNCEGFIFMETCGDSDTRSYPRDVVTKYAVSSKLGSGAYGEVRLAFDKSTGVAMAMKIIAKNKFLPTSNSLTHIQREIRILKRLSHPFVIKFIDVIDRPDNVFICMELVQGGELFRKVEKSAMKEADAKYIFYQLALAVSYLHKQGIIHRDIKLENILLASSSDSSLVVKLADFGLSNFVDAESMFKTYCGTPMYISPEVFKSEGRKGSYNFQADIWSMGVVLYMCLSGITPFESGKPQLPLAKQILAGYYSFPRSNWKRVSANAINLVKRMMTVDPKKRITITEIFKHPWLMDADMKTKVHRLLGPARRPGSSYGKENFSEVEEEEEDEEFGPRLKKPRLEEADTTSMD